MAPDHGPERPSESAAERTGLAWNRSGLAFLALGAVVAKGVATLPDQDGHATLGTTIVLLGIGLFALGVWQGLRRWARDTSTRTARPSDLLPITIGVVSVGIAAGALAVLR